MNAVTGQAESVVAELERFFTEQGAGEYLGEPVTQAAHMLQAAACAQAEGRVTHSSPRRYCTTSATSLARSAGRS